MDRIFGITLLYYVVSVMEFGVFNAEFPDTNVILEGDVSSLIYMMSYVLVMAASTSILLNNQK